METQAHVCKYTGKITSARGIHSNEAEQRLMSKTVGATGLGGTFVSLGDTSGNWAVAIGQVKASPFIEPSAGPP